MARMIEVRAEDIPRLLQETEGPFVLYLYSPLCGTCSLASQMLNIVIQTSASLPVFKCDVLLAPDLCQDWHIETIPCLVFCSRNKTGHRITRMESVDLLFREFKKWKEQQSTG